MQEITPPVQSIPDLALTLSEGFPGISPEKWNHVIREICKEKMTWRSPGYKGSVFEYFTLVLGLLAAGEDVPILGYGMTPAGMKEYARTLRVAYDFKEPLSDENAATLTGVFGAVAPYNPAQKFDIVLTDSLDGTVPGSPAAGTERSIESLGGQPVYIQVPTPGEWIPWDYKPKEFVAVSEAYAAAYLEYSEQHSRRDPNVVTSGTIDFEHDGRQLQNRRTYFEGDLSTSQFFIKVAPKPDIQSVVSNIYPIVLAAVFGEHAAYKINTTAYVNRNTMTPIRPFAVDAFFYQGAKPGNDEKVLFPVEGTSWIEQILGPQKDSREGHKVAQAVQHLFHLDGERSLVNDPDDRSKIKENHACLLVGVAIRYLVTEYLRDPSHKKFHVIQQALEKQESLTP
jgi:hypothetical protein